MTNLFGIQRELKGPRATKKVKKIFVVCLALSMSGLGCVSARMSDHVSNRLFRDGKYDEAVERLKKGLEKEGENGKDTLLYLMDIGLSLHSAGKYEESNKFFLKADKIAEIKDYTSISAEAATLLTSDNSKDYKGEDFEKVLINMYLSMNYVLMGDHEDALVEARKVNTKLYRMVTEGERNYKQNAFARYLSAIIYESDRNYNDAYVDYKNTLKIAPGLPNLGLDLWRCAWLLRMPDEMEKWDQQFNLSDQDHEKAKAMSPKSKQGEIVVLYENGISPEKRPNPDFRELPKFYPRHNPSYSAIITVNGQEKGRTALLEDIESTAIHNLEEKYAGLIAKKLAGVVAKESVAYGVAKATDSELAGALTRLFFYASDQADVRSWNLLPRDLQVLRIPVDPGTYTVAPLPEGGRALPGKLIQVEPGKKTFVNFRFMP